MQHPLGLTATALLFTVTSLGAGVAHASSAHARAVERAQIAASIRAHYPASGDQVTLGSTRVLDKADPCSTPPLVTLAGNGAYRTARIQCPALGWQFYIPFTVEETTTVVVAAHALLPGHPLAASDLRVVHAAAASGAATVARSEQAIIGQTLTVPVARGEAIALAELQEPVVVHSGENLTVHVESASVKVTTTAVALQNGRINQTIWVKNATTGKRYHVTVTGEGSARYRIE